MTLKLDHASGEPINAVDINDIAKTQIASMTTGEAYSALSPVFVNPSDNKVYKSDPDTGDKNEFDGIALEASTGADETKLVQFSGLVSGLSGLTEGEVHYVSISGTFTTTVTHLRVGVAITSAIMLLDKSKGGEDYMTLTAMFDAGSSERFKDDATLTFDQSGFFAPSTGGAVGGRIALSDTTYADVIGFNAIVRANSNLISAVNGGHAGWGIATAYPTFDDASAWTADHIGFSHRLLSGTTTHKYYASVGNGSTETKVEITGLTTANYHLWSWRKVGSEYRFYVDGVLEATINTGLPSDGTTVTNSFVMGARGDAPSTTYIYGQFYETRIRTGI